MAWEVEYVFTIEKARDPTWFLPGGEYKLGATVPDRNKTSVFYLPEILGETRGIRLRRIRFRPVFHWYDPRTWSRRWKELGKENTT